MQKATGTNKFQTQKRRQSLKGRKEEGSGEIQRKAPMPEWEDATEEEGFGETRRKHLCRSQKCAWETGKDKGLNNSKRLVAIKRGFRWKTQFTPEKKCEENPQAIPISRVKRVKRETAPTSDSAQFILAWRSEDSAEKRKKPPKRSPARRWQQRNSRSSPK